jgi:hypothetical protein
MMIFQPLPEDRPTLPFNPFVVGLLVLLLVAVTYIGALRGDFFLNAIGGRFFDIRQQIVVAGMMIVLGVALPSYFRACISDLLGSIVAAELLILAMVGLFAGGWDWYWTWRATVFTTLPYAVAVGVGCVLSRKRKRTNEKAG